MFIAGGSGQWRLRIAWSLVQATGPLAAAKGSAVG
jgi:hypothetical protein